MRTAHSILFELVAGDVLALRREIVEQLPDLLGRSYADIRAEFEVETTAKVGNDIRVTGSTAIINVMGPITRYHNMCSSMFGGTSVEEIRGQFRDALSSAEVGNILLYVNSPGGTVDGIADIADEIYQARGKKPITAYVDAWGASAAYWIVTAAEHITVSQTGSVGSIGVYATVTDDSADRNTVRIISAKSPRKVPDIKTEEGIQQIQARVDKIADFFIAAVAKQRGVSVSTVEETFGKGDVVLAHEAVALGMADAVGTFDQALTHARQTERNKQYRADITRLTGEISAMNIRSLLRELKHEQRRFTHE
jgi:ClpP class serine protease